MHVFQKVRKIVFQLLCFLRYALSVLKCTSKLAYPYCNVFHRYILTESAMGGGIVTGLCPVCVVRQQLLVNTIDTIIFIQSKLNLVTVIL